jgi:hypothetical protein
MPPLNLRELLDLTRYPGRFEPEHAVIGDWLAARGAFYDRIEFNVHLGAGVAPPADLIEPWRSEAVRSTQKRADIVAWLADGVVIIEAKGRATSDALGQLFTYRTLWLEANPTIPVLALEVICRRVNADDLAAFTANGVTVRLYERVEPAPG